MVENNNAFPSNAAPAPSAGATPNAAPASITNAAPASTPNATPVSTPSTPAAPILSSPRADFSSPAPADILLTPAPTKKSKKPLIILTAVAIAATILIGIIIVTASINPTINNTETAVSSYNKFINFIFSGDTSSVAAENGSYSRDDNALLDALQSRDIEYFSQAYLLYDGFLNYQVNSLGIETSIYTNLHLLGAYASVDLLDFSAAVQYYASLEHDGVVDLMETELSALQDANAVSVNAGEIYNAVKDYLDVSIDVLDALHLCLVSNNVNAQCISSTRLSQELQARASAASNTLGVINNLIYTVEDDFFTAVLQLYEEINNG